MKIESDNSIALYYRGGYCPSMDDSLSYESLFEGARTAAQKAMDDHARGEYDEFALHGGVAFERLAKAVLVSKNPAYLVEMRNGNSDMLLYLCGDLKEKPKNVRTVGATEAIGRLRSMGVLAKDEQLDTLIALRNGTAHTTVGDEAKTLLPALAANVEALMTHLNQPPHAIWGRWTSAIGTAVNQQRNEIQRDVEVRIKQARHLFEDRFKGLPQGVREHAISSELHVTTAAFDYVVEIDGKTLPSSIITPGGACPSCTADTTLLFGMVNRTAGQTQYAPHGITCHVCGLSLHGFDEMAALRDILGPSDEAYEQLRTEGLSAFFGSDTL
ncbi:hypothetical protein [Streptomyces sp. NPDC059409]|uniref:hypothetical protein n=1 Tax=Streptomyces sp. NPDC059409 TaxID=3346824 RepID=UPI0036A3CF0F